MWLCSHNFMSSPSVEDFVSQMFAVQPSELPASLLTHCSDCAAFIIGISFAFCISWWRQPKPRISPTLSEDMQLHPYIQTLWFPIKRCPGRICVVFRGKKTTTHQLNYFKDSVSFCLNGAVILNHVTKLENSWKKRAKARDSQEAYLT